MVILFFIYIYPGLTFYRKHCVKVFAFKAIGMVFSKLAYHLPHVPHVMFVRFSKPTSIFVVQYVHQIVLVNTVSRLCGFLFFIL